MCLVGQLTLEFSQHVLAVLVKIPFAGLWDLSGRLSLPQVLLSWTLTALSADFFLRDKRHLVERAAGQLPAKSRVRVRAL